MSWTEQQDGGFCFLVAVSQDNSERERCSHCTEKGQKPEANMQSLSPIDFNTQIPLMISAGSQFYVPEYDFNYAVISLSNSVLSFWIISVILMQHSATDWRASLLYFLSFFVSFCLPSLHRYIPSKWNSGFKHFKHLRRSLSKTCIQTKHLCESAGVTGAGKANTITISVNKHLHCLPTHTFLQLVCF